MKRTDEAFRNELFRRYGQYKKNRRNLRILAAMPGVVTAALVCALLFLPQLKFWQSSTPIGEQPESTEDSSDFTLSLPPIDQPNKTDYTLLKLDPSNPFYSAWEALKGTSVYSLNFTLPESEELSVQSISDKAKIDQSLYLLGSLMQTSTDTPEHDDIAMIFSSCTAVIDILGAPTTADNNLPTAQVRHSFQLVDSQYLRYGEGDWYKVDYELTCELLDFLLNDDSTLPSISEAELQAILDEGGYLSQVIERIGNPHRYGLIDFEGNDDYYCEWDLADGSVLRLWFDYHMSLISSLVSIRFKSYEFIYPAPSLPSITEAELDALIANGGSLMTLIDCIGEPHGEVASGTILLAWQLADGRTLLIEPRQIQYAPNYYNEYTFFDEYSFWESPLAELAERLKGCDVSEITVTPNPSDAWVGAASHFTDPQSIETILEGLFALTELHSLWQLPLEVEDQAALNDSQLAYNAYIIRLSGNPILSDTTDLRPDIWITNTVELREIIGKGCFLRYNTIPATGREGYSDWVQVDTTLAQTLIDFISLHQTSAS